MKQEVDIICRFGYQEEETVNNNVLCYMERHVIQLPEHTALRWSDDDRAKAPCYRPAAHPAHQANKLHPPQRLDNRHGWRHNTIRLP